jgi:ABC-type sugar transport system substrate-binding protein
METLLQKDKDINVIYSINEPSGFGGATALKAAGKDPKDFILVSVDGAATRSRTASSRHHRRDLAAVPAEDGGAGREKGAAAARWRRRSPRATPTPA